MFGTLSGTAPGLRARDAGDVPAVRRIIAFHLDAADELEASAANLRAERETSELRDQFIAVLGHDLRNPVAAIGAGIDILERGGLGDPERKVVAQMRGSVRRITRLIDDVLDFARGQLLGGMSLDLQGEEQLRPVIEHVVGELRQTGPERDIRTSIRLARPVASAPDRIGQLLSYLLSNALMHGSPDAPCDVVALLDSEGFTLSVSNCGQPIPPAALPNLFKPFTRASLDRNAGGLGLALYIAAQIAAANRGALTVQSDEELTRFTLSVPLPDPEPSSL